MAMVDNLSSARNVNILMSPPSPRVVTGVRVAGSHAMAPLFRTIHLHHRSTKKCVPRHHSVSVLVGGTCFTACTALSSHF